MFECIRIYSKKELSDASELLDESFIVFRWMYDFGLKHEENKVH